MTGRRRYRDWAADLATAIRVRHARRDGRMVIAGDKGTDVLADFNVGLSGVGALLVRVRDGGPRMWLPESQPGGGRWPCWETTPCCYSVTGDTNA